MHGLFLQQRAAEGTRARTRTGERPMPGSVVRRGVAMALWAVESVLRLEWTARHSFFPIDTRPAAGGWLRQRFAFPRTSPWSRFFPSNRGNLDRILRAQGVSLHPSSLHEDPLRALGNPTLAAMEH